MSTRLDPRAGQPAPASILVDVGKLLAAYRERVPDPTIAGQRVAFGTSGHRGSSLDTSFNEAHVLAITQALCDHRQRHGIDGPLFLGVDTHALSQPAAASALEVLAANGVETMLAEGDEFTPTPAVSHAILAHNLGHHVGPGGGHRGARQRGLADGIVVTPSHNPPEDGGFKYNPPHGGPAGSAVTAAVQVAANGYLAQRLAGVRRIPHAQALRAATTHRHDYIGRYVADLGNVVDLAAIRSAGVRMGVDPLGGAGVHYWARIAEHYRLDLTVVSDVVDPQFAFMTCDWDGRIRMDPSSPPAMQRLLAMRDRFDIAFACDTDHDRHGIVTPAAGLLKPDHYLAVMIDFLFGHRPHWPVAAAIGKTVVSTRLIDRLAVRLGRPLFEVPVGFKHFAAGLHDGTLGFGGEESAGAAFLRRDGSVWTTDKDGMVPALLSAEVIARTGRDPAAHYARLAAEFGHPVADRVDAAATPAQKQQLAALAPAALGASELAGEKITSVIDHAPGNGEAIGGLRVATQNGWFAARPSGTEDIYKVYAESFLGDAHLQRILGEAQAVVTAAITSKGG